ncbi:zinc finger Y-chromosomal protein 1-like [Nerophis lumbriciformis]|uniref:zinc finger Y-chromosomal protein 1-like n=1 Tax=Nerophis lumbriciformis TaxID=546530 RepID=UPI002AE05BDB|nr:endothelial zinc finger protein induced by tumor necrosis factor alpha-like [Nerophis lumbriciformis]
MRGDEATRWREVGCQWEPQEGWSSEVACQRDVDSRDVAVQVDLLTQTLGWRHKGTAAMPVQCSARQSAGQNGGAVLSRVKAVRNAVKTQTPCLPVSSSTSPQLSGARPQRIRRPPKWREDLLTPPEPLSSDCSDVAAADEATRTSLEAGALAVVKLEDESSVCDVCGQVMKNKSSLIRHSFIHTGEKPFACHLCELRFNRRDNLRHHLSHVHPGGVARRERRRPKQTWLCDACGKTFRCRSALKTHEVIHLGVKPHHCNLCPKAYMRTIDLEHHKKTVHEDGGERTRSAGSLLCDFCGKEFKFRSQLAAHLLTHTDERPHLCEVCGRKFCRQFQLERHKRLHPDGCAEHGTLPCQVCGRRFNTEAMLAAHSRVHTDEKPFRCGVCLRRFMSVACLKRHNTRVHLKMGLKTPTFSGTSRAPKVFPCSMCGKVFKFPSLLANHAAVHSEERPHSCDMCTRRFRRLSHLKRHRRVVHLDGARPPQTFICHICGKDKKCRSQLARHIIIHTGERPFGCELCGARFNRHGNLQQHRKRMHGVGMPCADEETPVLFDDLDGDVSYKQEEIVTSEVATPPE